MAHEDAMLWWAVTHDSAGAPCPVKPDCDDLEKPVIDALDKDGWFVNDSRIVRSTTEKVYMCETGPGVLVRIEELGQ